MPEKKSMFDRMQSYLSLGIAVIALFGWISTKVADKVGDKKDIEILQKDMIDVEADVETVSNGQVEADKIDAAVLEFMKQHQILHENLH